MARLILTNVTIFFAIIGMLICLPSLLSLDAAGAVFIFLLYVVASLMQMNKQIELQGEFIATIKKLSEDGK